MENFLTVDDVVDVEEIVEDDVVVVIGVVEVTDVVVVVVDIVVGRIEVGGVVVDTTVDVVVTTGPQSPMVTSLSSKVIAAPA